MKANKRDKIIYWILTLFVIAPIGGTGVLEFFTDGPASAVANMHLLGYPLYLLKILGLAKILGVLAILSGQRFPKLKEWAYAGFTFEFIGAAASHILAGDSAQAPLPLIFFALLMGSYFIGNKAVEPDATA